MKVQQGIKKTRALFAMLIVMVVILIPQIAQAAVDLSPEGIYNAMIAKKSDYPEGMPWTDSNTYNWYAFKEYTVYYTGGCAAFAAILSDAAFGDLAARQLPEKMYDAIRPGDILRINNDSHSVIVLRKFNDYVEVAEGNYNSSIHWGRTISKETLIGTTATPGTLTYIITRYPTDPIQHNYEVSSLVENTVTLRCSDCGLERTLTMPGSDVSLFFTEDGTHYQNPSKLSMMPDDTISLGLFIYSGGYLSLPSFDAETVECTISDGDVAVFSNGETTIQGRTATIKAVGGGTATLTVRSIYDDRVMFTKSIEVGGVQIIKGTPDIVGELKYGETLTPSVTNTNNTGTLSYSWQRSDGDGYRVWIASGPQYTLTKEDIGYYIELVVRSSVEEGYLFKSTSQVIQKADGPAAPASLIGVAPTKKGDADGKIQGVNATMEYATDKSFSDAKTCSSSEITGLVAGTYYVRIAETDTAKAGTEVSVEIPEGPEVIATPSVTLDSAAAKLDGTIGLQFYYLIPAELFDGENYALMEINGRSVKQTFAQATYDSEYGYGFTMPVYAKESCDAVHVRLYGKDGNPLKVVRSSGADITEAGFDYSVEQYLGALGAVLNDSNDPAGTLRNLIKMTRNYCYSAKIMFNHNAEGKTLFADLPEISEEELEKYQLVTTGEMPAEITDRSASLKLESETTLYAYLTFANSGDEALFEYFIDDAALGHPVALGSDSDGWYLTIPGIAAKDLDENHVFAVRNKSTGAVWTMSFSALTYARGGNPSESRRLSRSVP